MASGYVANTGSYSHSVGTARLSSPCAVRSSERSFVGASVGSVYVKAREASAGVDAKSASAAKLACVARIVVSSP